MIKHFRIPKPKIVLILSVFLTTFLIVNGGLSVGIEEIKNCMVKNNITCENQKCVVVEDFQIITGSGLTTPFIVSDYFHYNITIVNVGRDNLSETSETVPRADFYPYVLPKRRYPLVFNVQVFNPTMDNITTYSYYNLISIEPNHSQILYPWLQNKQHAIYYFDLSGTYKIEIQANEENLIFYKFEDNCKYTYHPGKYIKYFEAMPKWEYEWQKELRNQSEQNTVIMERTFDISKKMGYATFIILFLTLAQLFSSSYNKHCDRGVFWGIFLTILDIALIMLISLLMLYYLYPWFVNIINL